MTSKIASQRQLEEDMQVDDDYLAEKTLSQCFFTHYYQQSIAGKTEARDKRLPRSI